MQVSQPAVRGAVHGVAMVVVVTVVGESAVEVLVLSGVRSRTTGGLTDRRDGGENSERRYQAVVPQSPPRGELRVTHGVNIHEQPCSSCAPGLSGD
jgi:hypothetical protein